MKKPGDSILYLKFLRVVLDELIVLVESEMNEDNKKHFLNKIKELTNEYLAIIENG